MADKGEWNTGGQFDRNDYRDVRDREITTLTSYLYLGYTNLLITWLRYKKAKSKADVKELMKPIILNVIKDINDDPRVFGNIKAKNLEANITIKNILLNFK